MDLEGNRIQNSMYSHTLGALGYALSAPVSGNINIACKQTLFYRVHTLM